VSASWSPQISPAFSPFQEVVMASFQSPVPADNLLLNQALSDVLAAHSPAGENERTLISGAASNWIMEAYEQGVRDKRVLASYALKAMRDGRVKRF
jgi:hypothetical protein